jgi:hypothetical protein
MSKKKNNNNKLPMYNKGGFFQNTWDLTKNAGLGYADAYLSAAGLSNVVRDDHYQGYGSDFMRKTSGIAGQVGKTIAPMTLGTLGVPPQATMAAQQGLGMINPQDPNQQYNPMAQQAGNMAQMGTQLAPIVMAPHGGMMPGPNAELEKQENTLNPDGSTNQYNGPSHAQGGIPTKLDPGTLVFSDRLKMGKKTFAELNKPYNTDKEDKVINDPKKDSRAKLTAELMKQAKNKQSVALFQEQEALKAKKMESYGKKLGIENMAYGGVKKYAYGDPVYGPQQLPQGIMSTGFNPALYDNALKTAYGLPSSPQGFSTNGAPSSTMVTPGVLPVSPVNMNSVPATNYDPMSPDFNMTNSGTGSLGDKSLNLPWNTIGKVGTQVGLGLAANAGNIYDLYRSQNKFLEKEQYGRVNPNLVDPTQAIGENRRIFEGAVDSAREASVGNSSTFLNNRRALAAQRMRTNAGIRENFANQNAQIKNQAAYYNNDIDRAERIANMQNAAQMRNIRSNAYSALGHNVYNQGANVIRDQNMSDRDKQYLQMIAKTNPEVLRDPEVRKWLNGK